MKKIISVILTLALAASALATAVSAVQSYYLDQPTITGEQSRDVEYLYDGVTLTKYDLANTSKYKRQQFSIVEFDPTQDDLYVEMKSGGSWLNSFAKPSAMTTQYNNKYNGERRALCAINGDMWGVAGDMSRTSANSIGPANVTSHLYIPRGFTMYDGEIVCSSQIPEELPWNGDFHSFGMTSDGRAVFGNIKTTTTLVNTTKNQTISVDGINRIPDNNCTILYTDKGPQTTHCLSDAYEITIDCGYDYCIRHGATVTGTVTSVSAPGQSRATMKANRLILVARGTDITNEIRSLTVGCSISVSVSIRDDLYGNTETWYDVDNCVGGHMPTIINGQVVNMETQTTNYPTSIIGVKKNGNVIFLTSYGRQGSGYSYGLYINQLDDLSVELDLDTAFLLDGGGSAAMACETASGDYTLTGLPCDSGHAERSVVNGVILACGPSKSGVNDLDIDFTSSTVPVLTREADSVGTSLDGSVLTAYATGHKNPNFKLDLFYGPDAAAYKYMAITAKPTETDGGTFTLGLTGSAGRDLDPSLTGKVKTAFQKNGTYQTNVVTLGWSGRMNFVRFDLFDDTGIGTTGEGIDLKDVKFFTSLSAANAYAASQNKPQGDVDGNGTVNLTDATLLLKYIARWNVTVDPDRGDVNGDGKINVIDAVAVLKIIAN